ncbi:glycosyltransferase [Alcanivorax sp. S71-1-4]|uniref:glycosyltransferase n=1 Tax=Alcanivorax sp. S71-1-4 TaxID=1177159 RepID=UPI002E2A9BC8|nr:glycosyltransferase [Alcanivorax sp. S71-1-4]
MASRSCWLSVIVPTLNEARGIAATLAPLQPWRDQGVEVLVVDGGSTDDTLATAQPLADQVLVSPAGRAAQMNAGAAMASAPLLWFLHADSGVASGHLETLRAMTGMQGWGFFPVRLSGRQPLLRLG